MGVSSIHKTFLSWLNSIHTDGESRAIFGAREIHFMDDKAGPGGNAVNGNVVTSTSVSACMDYRRNKTLVGGMMTDREDRGNMCRCMVAMDVCE
jgi:hypothetical protein